MSRRTFWYELSDPEGCLRLISLILGTICSTFYLATIYTIFDGCAIIFWIFCLTWFFLLVNDLIFLRNKWTKMTDGVIHMLGAMFLISYGVANVHIGGQLIVHPVPSNVTLKNLDDRHFFLKSRVVLSKLDEDGVYLVGSHTFILGSIYFAYGASCAGVSMFTFVKKFV